MSTDEQPPMLDESLESDQRILAHQRFLANLSHELRTPLNSLIGFANILIKEISEDLEERHRTYLERMKDNGELLLHLVNEINDLSDLQSGKTQVLKQTIEWDSLLNNALAPFQAQADAKGLVLKLDLPTQIAPWESDAEKLGLIIHHLLSNALKFTSQGEVCLRLKVDAAGHPQCLEVQDTGIGIPEDQFEAIFEAFVYLDNTKTHQGSGLGLAMSRSLSQVLGLSLEVKSQLGQGSCFSLIF